MIVRPDPDRELTHVNFFSGVGGCALGLKMAGFALAGVVLACEAWAPALPAVQVIENVRGITGPRGAEVLEQIVKRVEARLFPGAYAWHTVDQQPLAEPVPMQGLQKIWRVSTDRAPRGRRRDR